MAKKKATKRTRNVDTFVSFRRLHGLLTIKEMAEEIKVDYQKLLRLSKSGVEILKPQCRVLGSDQEFYSQDDIEEIKQIVIGQIEGLSGIEMAKLLGLHPSFFTKAVAQNPELKPENGEFYREDEKDRLLKLMIIKPENKKK